MHDIIMKPRFEPKILKTLRCLNKRMQLSPKDMGYYLNLKKGFEGEKMFDTWLGNLSNDLLVLNDLIFDYNNTVIQIDSLMIAGQKIYIFEIKNFEGNYYIKDHLWYKKNGKEITNPLAQLNRIETLLRRLLQEFGFNFSIEKYLVFVNPEFYLYLAPLDQPIVFPTQLNHLINNFNNMPSKLSNTHYNLAKKLISYSLAESPYTRYPLYSFETLQNGITCPSCNTFYGDYEGNTLCCNKCGYKEGIKSAILRNVEEYQLLFPDNKICTDVIYEWCDIIKSIRSIQRVLSMNFKVMGQSAASYYVNDQD